MVQGRKTSLRIRLTPADRQTLLAWQWAETISAGQRRRGQIVLLHAEGMPIAQIARTVEMNRPHVYKWVQRFLTAGLGGWRINPVILPSQADAARSLIGARCLRLEAVTLQPARPRERIPARSGVGAGQRTPRKVLADLRGDVLRRGIGCLRKGPPIGKGRAELVEGRQKSVRAWGGKSTPKRPFVSEGCMGLRVGTLAIVLVLCLVMAALAQPTTDQARKERAEWETALEQLKRDKPKEYDDTKRTATLAAQVLLGRLGYGLGPYTGVLDATTTSGAARLSTPSASPRDRRSSLL